MNKYRRERIDMIVAMIMFITHLSRRYVEKLVQSTRTYQDIVEGEECTLYDSYSSNLSSIVDELKKQPNVSEKLDLVTDESIIYCNNWMRINKIQNAKQFTDSIIKNDLIKNSLNMAGRGKKRKYIGGKKRKRNTGVYVLRKSRELSGKVRRGKIG